MSRDLRAIRMDVNKFLLTAWRITAIVIGDI